jgi:phosphoglycolate phosphatase-like HAD superfamily hydrolase
MPSRPVRLVLFDIDGTLVLTGRAGVRGMNAAFQRLYGRPEALDGVSIAGRTDRAIVTDVLAGLRVDVDDALIAGVREAYLRELSVEIHRPVAHWSGVLPGVGDLLEALERRDDVAIGLLTGNFEGGAAIKLGHFDLWRRFRFGAYGDHHISRRDLVPVAIAEAARAGVGPIAARDVIVIGDTPLDIDCAVVHGARAVGVATGPFTRADLSAAGADFVVDTLEHAVDVERWI